MAKLISIALVGTVIPCSSFLFASPLLETACPVNTWQENLPTFLSKTKIVASLFPAANDSLKGDRSVEKVIGSAAKRWDSVQNTYVFVVETEMQQLNSLGVTSSDEGRLIIALLRPSNSEDGFQITARTAVPISLNGLHFNRFDLAPYRFSPSERGFGVRTCQTNVGTQRMAVWERLILFKVTGQDIGIVLETAMYEGDFALRGGADADDKTQIATISIDSKKTNGYFNLLKRSKNKSAVFRWDGRQYTTNDADPLR